MSDQNAEIETVSIPKKDFEIIARQAKAYEFMVAIGKARMSLEQIEKELRELKAD